jgi:hypothetical protein
MKKLFALLAALPLAACVSTGDPTTDRVAIGAAGGAVMGQLLGGDTTATLAGAVLGGIAGGVTAPQGRAPAARGATLPNYPTDDPCAGIAGDHAYDLCMDRHMQ